MRSARPARRPRSLISARETDEQLAALEGPVEVDEAAVVAGRFAEYLGVDLEAQKERGARPTFPSIWKFWVEWFAFLAKPADGHNEGAGALHELARAWGKPSVWTESHVLGS